MAINNFDKILTWADFTEVEPKPVEVGQDTEEGASIGVTWEHDFTADRKGNEIYVKTLVVTVIMPDPTLNTVVRTKKSDAMLKHEQGHYDIIALGAREFHKKGLKLTAASDTELIQKLDDLFSAVKEKADIVDARYDVKTKHHINKEVQAVWNKAIGAAKTSPGGTVADLPE